MLAFSALADPTRRRIVEMIASSGKLSATSISNQFSMSPPAISQHLKVLRNAGLVQVESKAQQRIYSINAESIDEMEKWLHQMREHWQQRFDALDELLSKELRNTKQSSKGKK